MSEASLNPSDTARAQVDEQRIARGVALGLPLVTLSVAAVVGLLLGPATAILVIAAGILLGVIALLWASLRVLSGDAPLSPELEALDMAAQGVDALASRKKMLLRQLKDLENERAIGKIDPEDYEQISATYRDELKSVLKRIDDSLAPHRSRAEEAARVHLAKAGILDAGYRGAPPPAGESSSSDLEKKATKKSDGLATPKKLTPAEPWRIACPQCSAANERDAKFCKECAAKLTPDAKRVSVSSLKAAPAKGAANDDEDETDDEEEDDDA